MATVDSKTLQPVGYSPENSVIGDIENETNVIGAGASNTTYCTIHPYAKNSDSWIRWNFDLSSIPANATIDSVACSYKAKCKSQSSSYTQTANAYLAAYDTTKTEGSNFRSISATSKTIPTATWTREELAGLNLLLLWNVKNVSSYSAIQFYGADLTVQYTYENQKFMLKLDGAYHNIARVFKMVDGIWVEQESLEGVVDTSKKLVNGGEIAS